MNGHTHDLAEWAAFLSLGLSISSAASIPFWLLVDAGLADFDPRPWLARGVEPGRLSSSASRLTSPKGVTR